MNWDVLSISDDMFLRISYLSLMFCFVICVNKCSRVIPWYKCSRPQSQLYCYLYRPKLNCNYDWDNNSVDTSTLFQVFDNDVLNESLQTPEDINCNYDWDNYSVDTSTLFQVFDNDVLKESLQTPEDIQSGIEVETSTNESNQVFDDPSCIVGGETMDISKAPSYTYIIATDLSGSHACSGNLITSSHVLTAAHCVSYETLKKGAEQYVMYKPSQLAIRMASSYANKGGRVVRAKNIQVHPAYGEDPLLYGHRDVAVITLSEVIKYDLNVYPALIHPPLSEKQIDQLLGTKCTVAGWGKTNEFKDSRLRSDHLLQVSVSLIPMDVCKKHYTIRVNFMVHICTMELGKSGCHGDSGGGLFCQGKIIGVVSWGDSCSGSKPIVYARVDNVEDFIKNTKNN